MLRFSYHSVTLNNSIMKQLIRHLSLSNLLVGIIAMPFNFYVLICKDGLSCNTACLARYFLTFIFSTESLIILAVLCHYRRDLIIKVPFGRKACVTTNNKSYILLAAIIISFLPNLALSSGYLYLMITVNSAPCQPDEQHKKTTHYYLGIVEGVKTGILFGVCFTLIIKDASKIRQTLAEQASRIGRAPVGDSQTQKVNANVYFAVVFIVMWIPFSLIAVFASYIPKAYYEDAYTVGYTLSYSSFALLPICYALTDQNFKTYVKSVLGLRTTRQGNAVLPLKDVTTKNTSLQSDNPRS